MFSIHAEYDAFPIILYLFAIEQSNNEVSNMKHVQKKALTSNELVNKLLISNPKLDTKFNYLYHTHVVNYIKSTKLIDILTTEFLENRLTQEEFDHILFDYFDLPNSLNQLSDTIKIDLIEIDKFVNELKNDKSYVIRHALASNGYYLDKLTYDPHYKVRAEVAKHYHNLEILKNDANKRVRDVAIRKLKELCEEE